MACRALSISSRFKPRLAFDLKSFLLFSGRISLSLHDYMHGIRPRMGVQLTPTAMHTYLPQGAQYDRSAAPVEQIRRLSHALPSIGDPLWVSFQQSASAR